MPGGIEQIGRLLITTGVLLVVIGAILMAAGKVPWIGRLPGDIIIQRKNFTFYFPLATSVLLSILLTLFFWFMGRR